MKIDLLESKDHTGSAHLILYIVNSKCNTLLRNIKAISLSEAFNRALNISNGFLFSGEESRHVYEIKLLRIITMMTMQCLVYLL